MLFSIKNGGYILSKVNDVKQKGKFLAAVYALVAVVALTIAGNCFAGEIVKIKVYPEHVGVFTSVGTQQFVAFGYDAEGKSTNITRDVNWISSQNSLISINTTGLATINAGITSGQVKISCSYPKTGALAPTLFLLRN